MYAYFVTFGTSFYLTPAHHNLVGLLSQMAQVTDGASVQGQCFQEAPDSLPAVA